MTLMDRIKIKDYLSFSLDEKYNLISQIQSLRLSEQALARIKKGRKTKSATKNIAKKGKRVKDIKKIALTSLGKLSPTQLAKIQKLYQ